MGYFYLETVSMQLYLSQETSLTSFRINPPTNNKQMFIMRRVSLMDPPLHLHTAATLQNTASARGEELPTCRF